MGKIAKQMEYTYGDLVPVKEVIDEINIRQQLLVTTVPNVYTVGTGGDYSTLKEALADVKTVTIDTDETTALGTTVIIELLAGYVMTEQVVVKYDLSHVFITGVPLVINFDAMETSYYIDALYLDIVPAIYIANGVSPIFDVDINATATDTNLQSYTILAGLSGKFLATITKITTNIGRPIAFATSQIITTDNFEISSTYDNWSTITLTGTNLYLGGFILTSTHVNVALVFELYQTNLFVKNNVTLNNVYFYLYTGSVRVGNRVSVGGTYRGTIYVEMGTFFMNIFIISSTPARFDLYIYANSVLHIHSYMEVDASAFSTNTRTLLDVHFQSTMFIGDLLMNDNANYADIMNVTTDSKIHIRNGKRLVGNLKISKNSELAIGNLTITDQQNIPVEVLSDSKFSVSGGGTATGLLMVLSGGSVVNLRGNNSYNLPQAPNVLTTNGIIYQN